MHYDIAIIGAGPGGYTAADEAAKAGKTVVLFEERDLGGTCLNRGCIPTKALIHAAELAHAAGEGADVGVSCENVTFDMKRAHARKDEVVGQLRDGIAKLMKADKVNVVAGHATIVGAGTIECAGERYEADDVVIATGSIPNLVPIPGIDGPGVYTSDDLLEGEPTELSSIAIIGGGVIGMEIAGMYANAGVAVHVLEAAERILPPLDKDIAQRVAMLGKKQGMSISAGVRIQSIAGEPGDVTVTYLDKKGAEQTLAVDGVLAATGRRSNLSDLFAEGCGCEPEIGRGVVADASGATSVEHLWVIGDAKAGNIQLAHVATAQARNVVAAICGEVPPVDEAVVPSCVYTSPDVASVGMTEAEAKDAGIAVKCAKAVTGSNGKCLIENAPSGFIKLVTCADDGVILGAQLVFPRATDMIAELALAVQLKLTAAQLARVIHPHPTFCEAIGELARDLSR